jgi:hypothetical protein
MATDMSLGGGAGFGAGYTPIRFAPLVSLTGPVMAPATPAAPEAAAPMLRPPMMADQSGGYEIPTRTDAAFQNLQPIGNRIEQNGIGPELRDLGRGLSFMASPLVSTGSLLATGKLPLDYVLGEMGGAAQPGGQATPQNPFANVLEGLRNFLFGPQQESVPLGGSSAGGLASQGPGMGSAVFSDAMNATLASGASELAATQAGRTALGLFAQGMDPQTAVTLAANYAAYADRPQMPTGSGGISPTPGAPAFTGIEAMPMDIFGNPYSSVAGAAPAAPQAAQTFGLGQPSESSYSGSDFGGGNVADNSGISYDISDFR